MMIYNTFILSHFFIFSFSVSYIVLPHCIYLRKKNTARYIVDLKSLQSFPVVCLVLLIAISLMNWTEALSVIPTVTSMGIFIGRIIVLKYIPSGVYDKKTKIYIYTVGFISYSFIILQKNFADFDLKKFNLFYIIFLNMCSLITWI